MPGIIVVGGVLLQLAAQQHAAGDHNEVGGQDHQNDRHKEQRKRHQRLPDGDCHVVGGAQHYKAQQSQEPVGARRLFAGGFTLQQADGRGAPYRHGGPQQKQQVNNAKNDQ